MIVEHTAENINFDLMNMMKEWGISEEKVVFVVTDNARNVTSAVVNTFGRSKHLGSLAHLLNLAVSDVIVKDSSINSIIKKVHKNVSHFKHCVNDYNELRKNRFEIETRRCYKME